MLTDVEDSLLAMSEGEPAQLDLAVQVLSSWYSRRVARREVEQIACRLAKLGFVRRNYRLSGKVRLSKRVPIGTMRSLNIAILATENGRKHLHET
jgi:hypothetical protein